MDLIIYQVMQLQVVHESDRGSAVKRKTGTSIAELNLTIGRDRNTLPLLTVIEVCTEVLIDLRIQLILMKFRELLPALVCVIVRKDQGLGDIILVCAIEDRGRNIDTQNLRSEGKMQLEHLSDVHSGRYAERVQYDIERTTVRKVRQILYRKYA